MKIGDDQRKRFGEVVRDMEKKIQAVLRDAQDGAKPEKIYPKVMKLRKEHESRIEALLTEPQRELWKELLGKPFELND